MPFNWFDVFLLVWLAMGIFRGRKRGMSEELLTVLQWVVTMFVCAFTYQMLGSFLSSQFKAFGPLSGYVTGYLFAAAVVTTVFLVFKHLFHGKLVGSDVFGKSEYYLGMPAGMLRFTCMLMTGLALLNARLYTNEELKATAKFNQENYGKDYFPGLRSLQVVVFEQSLVGPQIKKFLGFLLITPTPSQSAQKFRQKEWNATP